MILGISPEVLWIEVGCLALCGLVIGLVAWSMRNPKSKK